jgi:hypothetical protein
MYPALIQAGYSKKLSMGALSSGGTLGIIIPPSIPMIIFAIMAGVSVVDLFKAGIGPGIVLVILLCGYMLYASPKKSENRFSIKDFLFHLKKGILSLLMPLIILGGIYSGFFNGLDSASYRERLKNLLLNGHDPKHVILLEIEPEKQNTGVDFYATKQITGIEPICITKVIREDRKLFYILGNEKVEIKKLTPSKKSACKVRACHLLTF